MNIELKNIKYSASLSRETNAFTANLYIEDKRVGTVINDGHGGNTSYQADNKEAWDIIRQAENYCKALPEKQYPKDEYSEAFSFPMDLETYIDDLLTEYLVKKDLEKHQKKGVLFGVPNALTWTLQPFTRPLKDVLAHPNGAEIIANSIAKNIYKNLKDGVMILNTNIPESILKMAGLSNEQYVKPSVADVQQMTKLAEERNEPDNSRNRTR